MKWVFDIVAMGTLYLKSIVYRNNKKVVAAKLEFIGIFSWEKNIV